MQIFAGNSAITVTFTLQGRHPEAKLQVPRRYSSSPTLPKPRLILGVHWSYRISVQQKMEKLWGKLLGSRSTLSPGRATQGVPKLWGCQACSVSPGSSPHQRSQRRQPTGHHFHPPPCRRSGAGLSRPAELGARCTHRGVPGPVRLPEVPPAPCRDARVTPRSSIPPSLLHPPPPQHPRHGCAPRAIARPAAAAAADRGGTGEGPRSAGSPPEHGLTWRAGAAPPSCCPPRRARSW